MTLLFNILRFEGTPFKKPVPVFKYDVKGNPDWTTLGWILRKVRMFHDNRELVIIQDGKSFYSMRPLSEGGSGILDDLSDPEIISLSIANQIERNILTKMLGEGVAVNLRQDHLNNWKIEEITRTVYEVSSPGPLEGFGDIAVYKGFRYQPLIMENGRAGIIIDPKFKFHSTKTLRTLYDDNDKSLEILDERDRRWLVDVCPVTDCPEKGDAYSICVHGGTGKTVLFSEFEDTSPSDVVPNLIEYHRREIVCPRTPLLSKNLTDTPPVALIDLGSKEYAYPLERLRLIPTFNLLDPHERKLLMNKIRPYPSERFSLTEYYGSRISHIPMEGVKSLFSEGFRKSWDEMRKITLNKPLLTVYEGRRTRFPHRDVQKYGPADLDEKPDEVQIVILFSKSNSKSIAEKFASVIDGKEQPLLPSFQEFLRKDASVVSTIDVDGIEEKEITRQIISLQEQHQSLCAVVLHSQQNDAVRMSDIEKALIMHGIPKQGMSCDEFSYRWENKQKGYFRNVYLGIYAKVGGLPWILPDSIEPSIYYLGHSGKTIGDDYHYCQCCYTNNGKFLGGRFDIRKKDDSNSAVFDSIAAYAEKAEKLVLLVRGKDYTIYSMLDQLSTLDCEINVVEIVNTSLRFYRSEGNKIHPPEIGSGVELTSSSIGLVTTSIPFGTPDPILLRNIYGQPAQLKDSLQTIFNLTQCYTGYEKYSIKLPLPLHAVVRGLSKGIALALTPFDFKDMWFV